MLRYALICAFLAASAMCQAADARKMKLTIYDDGISCPGGCDAHVVINAVDVGTATATDGTKLGTKNAFLPSSKRSEPRRCIVGEVCRVCFDQSDTSCIDIMYRGGGPRAGTFDFTPAFYDASCPSPNAPAALKAQCASLDAAARRGGYDKRTNCFEDPSNPKCVDALKKAKAAQDADYPIRQECLRAGERAFNRRQRDPSKRRSNGCNYTEAAIGGRPGRAWKMLVPAACRPGTFVDRFGLDCCSASVRFAAANHPECVAFFPR